MPSRLEERDGGLVVVEAAPGATRTYRVLDLDEEPGREPTEAEQQATAGLGGPPPRNWGLSDRWQPMRRPAPACLR